MTLTTVADDGIDRRFSGLLVVAYDIPIGCVLMPIWHHAIGSKTPATKTVPVTVQADEARLREPQLEDATG